MQLSFAWRERRTDHHLQTPRRFLDFQVDGASLYEAIAEDRISCFGWLPAEADERFAAQLLLEEAPDLDGRVAIYVCPECADNYCGATTAVIERKGQKTVWRDVASSNPDWWAEDGLAGWFHEPATSIADLEFDIAQYSAAIKNRPRTEAER
jgi:hypothetical protein